MGDNLPQKQNLHFLQDKRDQVVFHTSWSREWPRNIFQHWGIVRGGWDELGSAEEFPTQAIGLAGQQGR